MEDLRELQKDRLGLFKKLRSENESEISREQCAELLADLHELTVVLGNGPYLVTLHQTM